VSDEGRLVAGRYRIIQRIGTGAMGAVWKAQDEVLARTVAIKQLLLQPSLESNDAEDARQRTMREGRIAARLHHPNAITVFDVVTDENDQPCLIMEYLNSTSLAEVLQARGTLPPPEVARIGAQVAAALKEAHAVGIVHRDIKPGNILLGGNGVVKITDFGISRAKDDVTVTKTGMIAGTPAYLAPEVAIGGNPGPESDIFSLGSTLYAACEGQPPFGLSENTLSLLHAVAAGQINPPRQSGPLASVLAVLLHPDIHHRPTAEESEELLSAVARGEVPLGGMGLADQTQMAQMAGVLGVGALGAAATQPFDEDIAAGHSGSLLDDRPTPAGPFYDDDSDDGYPPATGYPEDDYDRYDAPQRGQNGLNATRAVPVAAAAPHDDYDDYDDDYEEEPRGGYASPADDDGEKPGAWKKPAIIGGIVVLALIAMGFWLFSDPKTGDSPTVPPKPIASSSALPTTSETLPETTEESPTTTAPTTTTRKTTTSEKTTEVQQPPPSTPTTKSTSSTSKPPPTPTSTTSSSTESSSPPAG
jgi:serine/threonine protein kinase